jgi:nucleoside-diphosphate-sugar epimerase
MDQRPTRQIIIHTATADHLPSVQAVLDGIEQRAASNKPTIFIHTSGASVLSDSTLIPCHSPRIFSDTDPASINALPHTAFHRQVDLAIISAQSSLDTHAKIAIMIPPLIYGLNKTHNRLSIQIPTITRFALKHGFAGYFGEGKGVWSQIHVLDLARAYVVLLHRSNPYFFCENGEEFSWREVAENVGKALHERGLIGDTVPREFGENDEEELFGEYTGASIGLDSRSRAVRLRGLGWEAREKGVWESFREDELPVLLGEEG